MSHSRELRVWDGEGGINRLCNVRLGRDQEVSLLRVTGGGLEVIELRV